MRIILLSGGSGKRLWPMSNNIRSKQFLKLLPSNNGNTESMIQRIMRQMKEAKLDAEVTVATSLLQKDILIEQLGESVNIVTEPERRNTFPAIVLASVHLLCKQKCNRDEVIVVMPSDSYVDQSYFEALKRMERAIETDRKDLVLMGITPTEPSTKFGYIIPDGAVDSEMISVKQFSEKPKTEKAIELLAQGAFWNGGVFAFRLGYMIDIAQKYINITNFDEAYSRYADLPKISFDYEVVEKASSIGLVPVKGVWEDLGTWDSLTSKINHPAIGNVVAGEGSVNCNIINETETPVVCLGVEDLVVVVTSEGILVSKKSACQNLKDYID